MNDWAWIAAAAVLLSLWAWRRHGASRAERRSRPRELRDAEVWYIEKRFSIRRPVRLFAQIDRAYRTPDGELVLVELKTRWGGPQLSDIIQLSAQRLTIEVQTGQPVARHGFVTIQRPNDQRSLRSHRVQLWDGPQIEALARRREAVLDGRVHARYAPHADACRRCPYRSECGQ